MPTAYSYLRFSRPEQMRGDSQRRQVQKSEDWAARNKVPLDDSLDLRDLGVSAFRGKNAQKGALGLFLDCIENGRVKKGDFLVLENLDRLSRNEVFEEALPLVQRILRAGVSIVTLDPERIYSQQSVKDIGSLIEMLVIFYRANEESVTKSNRLTAAWENKRNRCGDVKLTAQAPKWLKLSDDRRRFDLIEDRVETVQRIFRLALDGMGIIAIAKVLNREDVPTLGRASLWQASSVGNILTNRAVLGEFQPHRFQDGKRIPAGEPIPDYYPAIIDETDFYRVQQGRAQRRTQPGRHGKQLTNLFTGLLNDARDGSKLVIVDKGDGPTLVSIAAKNGVPGSVYKSFPYEPFERSLLVWGYDLQMGDVLPRKATNLEDEIGKTEGKVADLNHRIATLKGRLETAGNFETLLDSLVSLEQKRTATQEKLERLCRENTTSETESLDRTKELIEKLQSASMEEVHHMRVKLRSVLKRLIQDIVVLVIQINNDRVALADVMLRNGTRRRVTIMPDKLVALPDGIEKLDVRNWKRWPKRYRATSFSVIPEEVRQMIDLEKRGHSRTEIAEKNGLSPSQVSRMLLRYGHRKQRRKETNGERQMTWHPGARGWVKHHKGTRYYISMTDLKKAYPRMVKEKTEEGSWRAANRWRKERLADMGE